MISPPKPVAAPKIERLSYRDWLKGVITAYDDGRTPDDGLRGSGNTILNQNGTLGPRPSLSRYGTQPTGTILGEVFEFVQTTGTTRTYWQIAMQNVAGTTRPYISKDGGSWSATSGKTYDNSAAAHFVQVGAKVLVLNGVDNLSYFDVSTAGGANTIVPYTALSTPAAPTVANNGSTDLTTGTTPFSITYRITANSTVGETIASNSTAKAVNTDRDFWTPTTQSLKLTWSAVTSAVSYNIYMGTVAGYEYLIASGVNGLQYIDDGSAPQDTTRLYPTVDSTQGPKATRGTVINGRAWLVGDVDQPFLVRYGGDYGFELDFSPANGGGFTPVGNGTKELPVKVMPFRDGRGNSQVTVLCQGTNGKGKRYILSPSSLTVSGTEIPFYEVIEDNGQDGTDSPDGVILYNDSLWYPSRDGFKTTGTKPQIQNLLSTDRVSNTIQPDVKNLNNEAMGMCVGLGFEGRLYWAVPSGSSTNNEIWVLDLDRDGAWMKPWNIAADWMMLYNDNDGVTHFLVYKNNVQYELSYSAATNDDGTAFATSATSGILKFSDDGQEWAKVIDVTFILLRPQGDINLAVSGKTEDEALEVLGGETYNPETSVSGWGEGSWESYLGWADSQTVPTAFGDARAAVTIEVDEILNWWKWELTTTTIGCDYQLSDVIVRFVKVGVIDTN